MRITVNKEKLVIAILSLAIYFLLEASLVTIIIPNYYEFRKFKSYDGNEFMLLISHIIPIVLTVLPIFLSSSQLIYSVLSLMTILLIYPSTIIYQHLHADFRVVVMNTIYFLAVYLVSKHFKFKLHVSKIKEGQKVWLLLIVTGILLIPFIVIFGSKINFQNLLLNNIYEARDLQKDLSNPYTGYVYFPLTNVLIPLLLLISFLHKEYFKAAVAIIMLLFMFLVGGHKAVFFGTFLTIYFYFGNYYQKIKLFFIGISIVLITGLLTYKFYHDFFVTALITRRIFFLPAILEVGYFDFFSGKPIFWSYSIFKFFIDYPFDLAPPHLIGLHVLDNSITHANNGTLSDGFMNLGIPGVIINILMVSFVFSVLDSLDISHRFFGLIFLLFFTFMSVYFFIVMITYGGFLFLIVGHFFLKNTRTLYHD